MSKTARFVGSFCDGRPELAEWLKWAQAHREGAEALGNRAEAEIYGLFIGGIVALMHDRPVARAYFAIVLDRERELKGTWGWNLVLLSRSTSLIAEIDSRATLRVIAAAVAQ